MNLCKWCGAEIVDGETCDGICANYVEDSERTMERDIINLLITIRAAIKADAIREDYCERIRDAADEVDEWVQDDSPSANGWVDFRGLP